MLKDQSFTCLGSKKAKKNDRVLMVLGDLDELISILGLIRAYSHHQRLKNQVVSLQEDLILIGGWLAGVKKNPDLKAMMVGLGKDLKKLQDPGLKKFSRPGVNQASAWLHLARVSARKLERRAVDLNLKSHQPLVNYLNRLSTWLFWLAVKEEKK